MSSKEDILKKYRANVREKFDMPDLSDIKAITYTDPLVQFIAMSESVGGHVIEVKDDRTVDSIIQEIYPNAKEIASNLPEVTIATRNPDTVGCASDLNGTDVGVIRGMFGVAENGCIWIVNNMHEAYKRITFDKEYDGYGTFISGPSKTADIAQVLVMGAQAARSVTILLMP